MTGSSWLDTDLDFVQFIFKVGVLCLALVVGIAVGRTIHGAIKEAEVRKCESAFIAAVVSNLDKGARHELDWITSFDPPEIVLERPECQNAIPNRNN